MHKIKGQAEAVRVFNYPYEAIEEALTKIEYFKSNNINSGFSGPKGDAYKYIALWCKKKNSNLSQSFLKRIRKWFP